MNNWKKQREAPNILAFRAPEVLKVTKIAYIFIIAKLEILWGQSLFLPCFLIKQGSTKRSWLEYLRVEKVENGNEKTVCIEIV